MIVECVICQETGLFKSSVTCNICKCKICRPCLLKMKSLKNVIFACVHNVVVSKR